MKVKPQEPKNAPGPDMRRVKDAHQKFDEQGREMMDPLPIAPPIGYKKAPSIAEQVRQMIRSEKLKMEAEAAGYETFEEADDFDVGDDFDPRSPYEEVFEPIPTESDEDRMKTFASHIGDAIMSKLGGDPEAAAPTVDREGPPAKSPPADTPSPGGGGTPRPSPSLDFTSRKPR